jgi:hypothetical protein
MAERRVSGRRPALSNRAATKSRSESDEKPVRVCSGFLFRQAFQDGKTVNPTAPAADLTTRMQLF